MVRVTLKQCAYFVAVAEQGGIAQAARALNISQPAVAQALDKLEGLYGLRLFLRHHARGTELTPQGRAFYRSAQDLLNQAARVERDAREIAADQAGIIRFACFHTVAPFHLARIIKRHNEDYPNIDIVASELLQDKIISRIEDRELDLALTYDMSLEGRPIKKQVLDRLKPFILLSVDHPLAARSSIRLAELAQEPFVMFDGPSSRDYFNSLLAVHGIDPQISFNSRSIESVRCAVASGLGFSLSIMTPRYRETYDGGRIVYVPIAGDVDPMSVVLIRRKEKSPVPTCDTPGTCVAWKYGPPDTWRHARHPR
jgi:DNA-binding transcriptional LysR family regulator